MKTSARLIIAPDDHAKMSSVRSADRRGRPRLGFLVPRWSPSRGRTFLSAAPPDSRHRRASKRYHASPVWWASSPRRCP